MILTTDTVEGIHLLGIDGPWYVQLGVVFSLIIAASTVLRLIVWPGLKRIWQAIIAAPRLAEGVGRLVELLEFDILDRVEKMEVKQNLQDQHIANLDAIVSGNSARLTAHDQRADAIETRMSILEFRITGEKKSDQ